MPYPIQLTTLSGAKALVTGGGPIAARKAAELVEAGARVFVVAIALGPEMAALEASVEEVALRPAREEDLEGAAIAVLATDDTGSNRTLAAAATARGILVNAVDDPAASTFFAPAVVKRGRVTVAIGTDGSAPLLSAQVRRVLEAALPRTLEPVSELLAGVRQAGLRGLARRGALLRALADKAVSKLVDRGDLEAAAERLKKVAGEAEEPFPAGTVVIAGAGPGARALLTLRALDRIQRAEVIYHDALVEPDVLAEALPGTRLVHAGRRAGCGGADQDLTEALMIRDAKQGLRVLRLHAGDPLVFGRGGEEIAALDAAGVPFELVPGVSSVLAAPAAAGIPLTMRGASRGVSIRTGHTREGYTRRTDGTLEENTLVILMGLGAIAEIMSGLLEEGRAADTPVCVIASASRAGEKVVTGTIADIAGKVDGIESPATIVVGEVARGAARAKAAAAAKGEAA